MYNQISLEVGLWIMSVIAILALLRTFQHAAKLVQAREAQADAVNVSNRKYADLLRAYDDLARYNGKIASDAKLTEVYFRQYQKERKRTTALTADLVLVRAELAELQSSEQTEQDWNDGYGHDEDEEREAKLGWYE